MVAPTAACEWAAWGLNPTGEGMAGTQALALAGFGSGPAAPSVRPCPSTARSSRRVKQCHGGRRRSSGLGSRAPLYVVACVKEANVVGMGATGVVYRAELPCAREP